MRVNFTSRVALLSCISLLGAINIVLFLGSINGKGTIKKYIGLVEGDFTEVVDRKTEKSAHYLGELKFEIYEAYRRFTNKERTLGEHFIKAATFSDKRQKTKRMNAVRRSQQVPLPDCKEAPFLLIQIHSTPSNFLDREAIRISWGRPENRINQVTSEQQPHRLWKTVFLVGQTGNPRLDKLLYEEANTYRDLIFGDFLDSYRNLTRKMAMGVEWAAKHCHHAQYVMKADTDSYINVHDLIKWLKARHNTHPKEQLFAGAAMIDKEPFREEDNPFYVSEEDYPALTYPPYVAGPGYVFSGNLLSNLSKALKVVHLFPNEDACFGALMQHIGVSPTNVERFIPFTMQLSTYSTADGYSLCQFDGPLVIHRVTGIFQIQTHFNVLVMRHAPTICDHIRGGIGEQNVDYFLGNRDGVWSW